MRRTRMPALRCLLAAWLLALAGACQAPLAREREAAAGRWNAARAQIKAQLAAEQLAAGNAAAAGAELAEALRLDPRNRDLVVLQARVLLAEGRIDAAAELLDSDRRLGPPAAEAEYLLGIVRQQQERWSDALEAFMRAAHADPGEVAYLTAATQAWLQLGQPRDARAFLEARAERLGYTPAYQAAWAEVHEQLGQWATAAAAWQRVSGVPGAADAVRERLAVALFRAARYADAAAVLVELVRSDRGEDSTVLRLMLAECHLAEGRPAAAREQVESVLQRTPEDARAWRMLARIHSAAGEHRAALRAARHALALDDQDARTLELTAALAWHAGEHDAALVLADRLLQREPGNPVALRIVPGGSRADE